MLVDESAAAAAAEDDDADPDADEEAAIEPAPTKCVGDAPKELLLRCVRKRSDGDGGSGPAASAGAGHMGRSTSTSISRLPKRCDRSSILRGTLRVPLLPLARVGSAAPSVRDTLRVEDDDEDRR